jgi:hypothetical protein
LDFRGRAYPIPPHLSHIGDDLSRGLLLFGEAKPLGERGLRWLKIHLANLFGYDKAKKYGQEGTNDDHYLDNTAWFTYCSTIQKNYMQIDQNCYSIGIYFGPEC